MRAGFRLLISACIALSSLAAPRQPAAAANLDLTADVVLGQANFAANTANRGAAAAAASLNLPAAAAVDTAGHLFVADSANNRVLVYASPYLSGQAATAVFGQPGFTTTDANHGGLVTAATLSNPQGVAVDSLGNLYVADTGNNRVLEYDAPLLTLDFTADRIFGQSSAYTSITGLTSYNLNAPRGVAVDLSGNLYVADTANNRVLRFDQPLTGDATADAVVGQVDFISNAAAAGSQSLDGPAALALDENAALYIADTNNHRVLIYLSPLPAAAAAADMVIGQPDMDSNASGHTGSTLSAPRGLALDAQGNLYVSDSANHRVLEFDAPILSSQPTASLVVGQADDTANAANRGGAPAANTLNSPAALAVTPSGDLLAADSANHRLLILDQPIPFSAPGLTAISPDAAAFGSPLFTLMVHGSHFAASSTVRLGGTDLATTYLDSTHLSAVVPPAALGAGSSAAVTVYTPTPGGGTSSPIALVLYAPLFGDTSADLVIGQPDFTSAAPDNDLLPAAARLHSPRAVAFDPVSGRVFAADSLNHRVLSWASAPDFANGQAADLVIGQPNFLFDTKNTGGIGAATLNKPTGLAVDPDGCLYVADAANNRVLAYRPPFSTGMSAALVLGQGGSFTTYAANKGAVYPNATASSLYYPTGVAVDPSGNLYVADYNNHRVLEFDTPLAPGADAAADLVFGQLGSFTTNTANIAAGSPTSPGPDSLYYPVGVAVDSSGSLYTADSFNHRVLVYTNPAVTRAVTASLVIGQPTFDTNASNYAGLGPASLSSPCAVALDPDGSLYVADQYNNRVLVYTAPLTSGAAAVRVIGQPSFSANAFNNGGVSAGSLYKPVSLALDPHGNLYTADFENNRILIYRSGVRTYLPLLAR